jgi:dolichol-phosphate mannosyltransferase
LYGSKGNQESVLVLLAAKNEEQGIGPTIEELKHFLVYPKFIVIDGRSNDNTIEIAKKFDAKILGQRGKGKGNAIAQGVKSADFNGKYSVMIDSDYTYPAKFIPRMIQILEENPQVGMICGNRFNSSFNRKNMGKIYLFGNQILAFTHNMLNGVHLQDPLTGLRVMRWDILKNWKPKSQGYDLEVELNHYIEGEGYSIIEIPIGYRRRLGKKKLKVWDGFTIFKRIILESLFQTSMSTSMNALF